jgi:small subunit ribosomal protein S13
MIRIAGVNVNDKKHVDVALTAIYGIGRMKAIALCQRLDIMYRQPLNHLSAHQIELLRNEIKDCVVESDLKRMVAFNIKRLIDINSYRGRRHKFNLPVNGQRTHSNANTSRKRKNVVAKKV